jgi:hypothetical protein
MPLSLLNHSALALFAQRTRIPTSARSIGFCAIWVCIRSSSSSSPRRGQARIQPQYQERLMTQAVDHIKGFPGACLVDQQLSLSIY